MLTYTNSNFIYEILNYTKKENLETSIYYYSHSKNENKIRPKYHSKNY